jgi:putative spermidine/putrescine transport system permease protein
MSVGALTAPVVPADPRGAWRHRMADRGIDRTLWLLLPAVIFVVALFVYPFIYGLSLSLTPSAGDTGIFSNYAKFFTDSYYSSTIWLTLRLAIPATLFNTLAAVPFAYWMRGRFPGKRAVTTLLVVPITLGTVLTAEGLLNFLGNAGWLNRFLMLIHVIDAPLKLTYNYWGVFLSLILSGFPFAFLLILSYTSGIDPTLERAASTLGASSWQRFMRITLPLLAPGLATTFSLAFVMAFSVFPSAIMLGNPHGDEHVIAIAAYEQAYTYYNYNYASAIAMVMGAVELLVIAAVQALRRTFYIGTTGGKGA